MKKTIAIIGVILAVSLMWQGITDFDKAKNGIELFKATFWQLIGVIALWSFIDDFKNNKWPF